MDLQGKTIVITGAAQGLGQKMAELLASHGANLALADLDHEKLKETVSLCAESGAKVRDYPANVTNEFLRRGVIQKHSGRLWRRRRPH